MKNTLPKDLFEKYTRGQCTEEEQAMVEGWYLNTLKTSTFNPDRSNFSSVQQEIRDKITARTKVNKRYHLKPLIRWTAIAAAVMLAILFVYRFQVGSNNSNRVKEVLAGSKALVASKTENSMMELPDGTIVILGQGSVLTLSDAFNKTSSREVHLSGKAFFDVKQNAGKPFIIYSGPVKTVVLGTSFDISANEGEVTVNVIGGKVRVEDANSKELGVLTKNMKMVYNNKAELATTTKVDAVKAVSWNKQGLEFNDISLEDATKMLEERFDIKITVSDPELKAARFSYSMRANDDLEPFIKSICVFVNATYYYNKNTKKLSIQPLNQ